MSKSLVQIKDVSVVVLIQTDCIQVLCQPEWTFSFSFGITIIVSNSKNGGKNLTDAGKRTKGQGPS